MLCVCVENVMDVVFFCLYCEAWSCRCSCMGSVSFSSCRCCMFVSCVHPVAVLNAAFCMTCSLLMLVEDAIGDHTEEALLLTKVGDVETNPVPTTLNKKVWICDICHKQIHVRKQISIRCNRIEHWVHLRCAGNRQAQYTDTWTCHLHR